MRSCLAVCACVLFGFAGSARAAPTISRATQGAYTLTLFGTGLDAPELEVLSFTPPGEEATILASAPRIGAIPPLEAPPAEARPTALRVLCRTSQYLVCAYPRVWDQTPQYVWARTKEGLSSAYLLNWPEVYFPVPDEVRAGGVGRVLGRHLMGAEYHARPYVFLRPVAGGEAIRCDWVNQYGYGSRYYQTSYRVPASTPPGDYELWFHNGRGGEQGWSRRPAHVRVIGESAPAPRFVDAAAFGARGNDEEDDTAALKRALAVARSQGDATVLLAPGRYLLGEGLVVPEGVTLAGAGQEATVLHANPTRAFTGAYPPGLTGRAKDWTRPGNAADWIPLLRKMGATVLVQLTTRCGLRDLRLESDGPASVLCVVLNGGKMCERVRIRRVSFENTRSVEMPRGEWLPADALLSIPGPTNHLEIGQCRFRGPSPVAFMCSDGVHYRAHVWGNEFFSYPLYASDAYSLANLVESLFESNVVHNTSRGFTFGATHRSVVMNNALMYTGMHENASEDILTETCNWKGFCGKALEGTTDGARFAGARWAPNQYATYTAVILAGRGVGEIRRVQSSDANGIRLTEPWQIVPDATSLIGISCAQSECLYLENTEHSGAGAMQLWGDSFGNVVDGQISDNSGGVVVYGFTAAQPPVNHLCYFNEFRNGRIVRRGNLSIGVGWDRPADLPLGLVCGTLVSRYDICDATPKPTHHYWPYWQTEWYGYRPDEFAGVQVSESFTRGKSRPEGLVPGVQATVIEGSHFLRCQTAARVGKGCANTVLWNNLRQMVGKPLVDEGVRTTCEWTEAQ